MSDLNKEEILAEKMAGKMDHRTDVPNIETLNFEASRDFLRSTQDMLREVLWQAPSDAVLKVKFKKVARGFVGLLYVSGLQKHVVATVKSHDLAVLPEILGRKMSDRLLAWKKTRVFA
jgi:hypothetical protein